MRDLMKSSAIVAGTTSVGSGSTAVASDRGGGLDFGGVFMGGRFLPMRFKGASSGRITPF